MGQQALQLRMEAMKRDRELNRHTGQQALWPSTECCWWHCLEVKGESVFLRDWFYGKNKLIEQINKKTEDY